MLFLMATVNTVAVNWKTESDHNPKSEVNNTTIKHLDLLRCLLLPFRLKL